MKRNFVLIILASILYLPAIAQYDIRPGKGFKDVKVNMHIDKIIAVIGKPESIVSAESEQSAWENSGYDTEKSLPFFIGFDHVYKFENNRYTIWKIYVKDKKAVYFTLSSYSIEASIVENITVKKRIKFYDEVADITAVFGKDYYTKIDEGNNASYFYFKKGIEFIFADNKIRNIYIFKPIKPNPKMIEQLELKPNKY